MAGCSNFSCSSSCSGTASESAGGCSGDCASNTSQFSGGTCSPCGGSCLGWCSGGCLDTCDGTCDGGCSGACQDSCANSCTASCVGGCKGNCGKGCNTGCTSNEALDLYQKLYAGLDKKILAADLNNIKRMIELEASANRFNKTITNVNFNTKDRANSSQIKTLQSNLNTIGQTTTKDASQKVKSWKATGQELIDKALASHNTTINSNATGQ